MIARTLDTDPPNDADEAETALAEAAEFADGAPQPPPRAPSTAVWEALTPRERARVVRALPASMTEAELSPPEGDAHRTAKNDTVDALQRHFADDPRGVYVGSELVVYYPDTQRFAPDVFVVFGVDPHPREKWVVSLEGKGPDFVLEVHAGGDRKKDAERNVALYAQVGIGEYLMFDARALRLHAWHLNAATGQYVSVDVLRNVTAQPSPGAPPGAT